ncbi:MAG: helix-turn-helix transcriptional regulator [Roseivirga sp.]|nr:helix-turn-helix transcriptional regulator [Roseivirga sp.]
MLIHEFPDIQWLKTKIREGFSDRKAINNIPLSHSGWPTVILNTATRQADRRDIKGPFSLFLNLRGKSTIGVDGKQHQINEQCYTLSNPGQHYDLIIDDAETTETLNIHLGEYFYGQSLKAISESYAQLLDNPFGTRASTHLINPRTLLRNEAMNQQLGRLLQGYKSVNNPDLQEEILFELLKGVMTENCRELKKTAALPIKSVAIREEISERLFLARDYIHSHFDREVALDELSKISCLSKFHFLRLFKQAFRQSPYQYQKALRVDRAMSLYKQGKTLEEIAGKVGVENASSISRMIYKQFGFYPSQLIQ